MTKGHHHPLPSIKDARQPKTRAESKLYFVFVIIFGFSFASFLLTSITTTTPKYGDSVPHLKGKESVLSEFLRAEKGKAMDGYRPFSGVTSKLTPNVSYHVVFSTSCTDQQNWESYVFFYHAWKVGQPGNITRIASGCSPKESEELEKFHNAHIRSMSDAFHLHLTPDFSRFRGSNGKPNAYKYMNKPYGLRHWLESVLKMNDPTNRPDGVEDGIVMLPDPDMVLLRPLVHDFTNEDVIFVEKEPATKIVKHGFPISQQDGYLSSGVWIGLNVSYITNGERLPASVTVKSGPIHWNTGPPYMATVRDMYQIAVRWTEYAPRVHDIHPKLFAEMYGFIFATTQLNLPFTMIKSIVVSEPTTPNREGWPYVDALPNDQVCAPPPSAPLPIGLHYCKRYLLDKWFFSKYRLKKNYISCEAPLLTSPPVDLATRGYDYWYQPPPHGHQGEWQAPTGNISAKQAKREAFMLCGMISAVNEAATYYKVTACNGSANMNKTYNFFDDPHHR